MIPRIKPQGLCLTSFVLGCVAAAFSSFALAQAPFPAKPVRFIVTVVPGGGADTLGRVIAVRMSDTFRQPVVVENITGASGLLAYHT